MGQIVQSSDPKPGATELDDYSELLIKQVLTREQLNKVEAENIHAATVDYLSMTPSPHVAPFDVSWFLQLHREMFGKVWGWAGRIRGTQKNIGVSATHIQAQLRVLSDDVHYWRTQRPMPALEQAARLHHRAVFIHPFENGNGRWARLLSNIWLKQQGDAVVYWPLPTQGGISPIRDAYLAALRNADQGDYAALLELHERYIR